MYIFITDQSCLKTDVAFSGLPNLLFGSIGTAFASAGIVTFIGAWRPIACLHGCFIPTGHVQCSLSLVMETTGSPHLNSFQVSRIPAFPLLLAGRTANCWFWIVSALEWICKFSASQWEMFWFKAVWSLLQISISVWKFNSFCYHVDHQ